MKLPSWWNNVRRTIAQFFIDPVNATINALLAIAVFAYILIAGTIGSAILAFQQFVLLRSSEERGRFCWYYVQHFMGPPVLWMIGVEVEYRGLESLTADQLQILVANHDSSLDVVVLLQVLNGRFVAKEEVKWFYPIGALGILGSQIFVKRGTGRSALETIDHYLTAWTNCNLIFFGSGTRSLDGVVSQFKPGAFLTALKHGASLIPVSISGSLETLKKGSLLKLKRGRKIVVTFGEKIPPVGTVEELEEKTRRVIIEQLAA